MTMSPTDTITQPGQSIYSPSYNSPDANIELQSPAPAAPHDQGPVLGDKGGGSIDPVELISQPSTTVSVVERWKHPMGNLYRTFAVLFAFTIMGANDAAYSVSSVILHIDTRC
jgi:hypothetical protein